MIVMEATRRALTMQEVASQIGVSYQTVRRIVRAGRLRSVQVGSLKLVPVEALDEFLSGSSTGVRVAS